MSHRTSWLRLPSPYELLAIVLAAGALGGAAYAAIPSSDGTITGCYRPGGGLRVIDAEAGQGCQANEQRLTWNQTGPQGEPGPQGPPGLDLDNAKWVSEEFEVAPGPDQVPLIVDCPIGKTAISGGFSTVDSHVPTFGPGTLDAPHNPTWRIDVRNDTAAVDHLQGHALCVPLP